MFNISIIVLWIIWLLWTVIIFYYKKTLFYHGSKSFQNNMSTTHTVPLLKRIFNMYSKVKPLKISHQYNYGCFSVYGSSWELVDWVIKWKIKRRTRKRKEKDLARYILQATSSVGDISYPEEYYLLSTRIIEQS